MAARSLWGWISTALATIALGLVVVNIVLASGNRDMQRHANQRQQFINQSIQLGAVHNQLVSVLGTLAAQANDGDIRNVLSAHGITVSIGAPQGEGSGSPGVAPAPAR